MHQSCRHCNRKSIFNKSQQTEMSVNEILAYIFHKCGIPFVVDANKFIEQLCNSDTFNISYILIF